MKKIVIIFLISFSFSFAQEGGSPYSGLGLGINSFSSSTRYLGMSGTNLGFFDTYEINDYNAVSWSKIRVSSFSAGAYLENTTSLDNTNSTTYRKFNFTQSFMGIPIEKDHHIVLGIGIHPVSKLSYNLIRTQQLDGAEAKVSYDGSGGLSEAVLGLTYSPIKDLDLGAKAGYYFGDIEQNLYVKRNNSDSYDIELNKSLFMKGLNFALSMNYSGLGPALKIPMANIAFLFNPGSTINGKQEAIQKFLLNNSVTGFDTIQSISGDINLPSTFGVGVCISPVERLLIGMDFYYQNWDSYKLLGNKPGNFQNARRFSIGAEYTPERDYSNSFFQKLILRFGLYYSSLNYKINNNSVNEYGVSVGFGIPISPISTLNTAFQYGIRGSKTDNLLMDRFFKVNFSFSISELWFINPNDD